MAPELLDIEATGYDHKVDIFALGLILLELMVPFVTEMERGKTMQDAKALKFARVFPGIELVRSMLNEEASQRPEACDILKQLQDLNHSKLTTKDFFSI